MPGPSTSDLVPGQITVDLQPSGFFLVQIGRRKYTKRFNLSRREALDLIDTLSAVMGGEDGA